MTDENLDEDLQEPVCGDTPDGKPLTINQRLASPQKPRLLFGGGISAHAAAYNLPRHFGRSCEAIMKAYEEDDGSD